MALWPASGTAQDLEPEAQAAGSLSTVEEPWVGVANGAAVGVPAAKPPQAPQPDVRLIITGDTRGVSSRVVRKELEPLVTGAATRGDLTVDVRYTGAGAVTDGEQFLFHPDGLGSTALATFLSSPPFSRTMLRADAQALRNDAGILVQLEISDPVVADVGPISEPLNQMLTDVSNARDRGGLALRPQQFALVQWRNDAGAVVFGLEPSTVSAATLNTHRDHWELVSLNVFELNPTGDSTATDAEPTRTVVSLELNWGEGSRRIARIEEMRRAAELELVPTILLDGGNALDGYSYVEGNDTSLHQPTDWDALEAAGYHILSPGLHELIGGVEGLQEAARTHQIELVSANLVDVETGAPIVATHRTLVVGGRSIAVTGVLSPSVLDKLPADVAAGLSVRPAADALAKLTQQWKDSGSIPDVVVVLTVAPADEVGDLSAQLEGVDVIAGLQSGPRFFDRADAAWQDAPLSEVATRRPIVMVAQSRTQVALVDLFLTDETRVQVHQHTIGPDAPRTERWVERVMKVRHDVYSDTEQALVPSIRKLARHSRVLDRLASLSETSTDEAAKTMDERPARLPADLWYHLVANLLRERFDADLTLLRPIPAPPTPAGPMRQLDVMAALAVPDQVVVYRLDAPTMAKLLEIAADDPHRPTYSGYDVASGRLNGRKLHDARTYRVVTTDELAERGDYQRVFGGLPVLRRFVLDGETYDDSGDGDRMSLTRVVLDGLQNIQDAHPQPTEIVSEWLLPQGAALSSVWFLWIREVALSVSQYTNVGDTPSYANARENRATTVDSLKFTGRLDLSFSRETSVVDWETRFSTRFGLVSTDEELDETDDDIVAQTELRVNAWSLTGAGARIPIVPFFNVLFDTEWTVPDERAVRQRDLRGTVGLDLRFSTFLDLLRVGVFTEVDFARSDRLVEVGTELVLLFKASLPGALVFSADLVGRYYFPSDGDNDADLGLTVGVIARLGVPVYRRLRFDVYVDAFVFRGKVEATKNVASSIVFGAQLHYDQLFAF